MTPVIAPDDVAEFRARIVDLLGLTHDERVDRLADVLRERMTTLGCRRFTAYRERLTAAATGPAELRWLADRLTVHETYFFRNADSFRAISEVVLPGRLRDREPERRLRVLSAGCASGEEPYSVAIALRELLPAIDAWDVRIDAVDISPAALARADRARFTPWSLRATPEDLQRRYFRADGREFVLDPAVRRMVALAERNLVDPDPRRWPRHTYDLVLCRNVLMYFDPARSLEIVGRLAESLVAGGYLFLGHAETLRGLAPGFELCHTHDTFYYRRQHAAATWSPPPPSPAPAPAPDGVWVDAIQHTSERIAALHASRTPAPIAVADPVGDLAAVLAALAGERFADALALLDALPLAVQAAPDGLLLRAAALMHAGRLAEAEALGRHLLTRDGFHAGAHHLLALCREHAGDLAAADVHDRFAVSLDAGFAMPHLHLGLMARRAGDGARARRELGHAALLLAREDPARITLFGGGFSRDTLLALCAAELRTAGGAP